MLNNYQWTKDLPLLHPSQRLSTGGIQGREEDFMIPRVQTFSSREAHENFLVPQVNP